MRICARPRGGRRALGPARGSRPAGGTQALHRPAARAAGDPEQRLDRSPQGAGTRRVVRRRVLPRPARAVVYELTEYGLELEGVVVELGRWGAKNLGDPRPDETITINSLMAGDVSPADAIANGIVHLTGDAALPTRFADIFRIEPMPAIRTP
ncbi:MAG TPA: winged helix-turn-helix transcriptional regulator [Candidatus Elarobacter sp.]|nr:winged helix-turn-helix transcriptional regulator [Candidatus Elarobacter sp.]